jgi:steroid 5-alpha reductase family enzyme
MTLLHSLLQLTNFRNPFLRTLIPSVSAAFALQTAVAIPSILAQSEHFYDLSGSLTYLSVTALSLYLPTLRACAAASVAGRNLPPFPSLLDAFTGKGGPNGLNWRQVVLSAAVSIWATRRMRHVLHLFPPLPLLIFQRMHHVLNFSAVGTYLFQRVLTEGKDSRFDKIKKSPPKFLVAFMAQATWVSLCLMPVLAVNSIPHSLLKTLPVLGLADIIGLSLYLGGLAFEITADRQKNAWVAAKKRKEHDEEFLTHGLWSKSRHPNYFGESTLWTGIAVTAAGVLMGRVGLTGMGLANSPGFGRAVAAGLCAANPAFVTFLMLKVSGVPLSENKYDKKYGDCADYKKWKRETPMFIPKF